MSRGQLPSNLPQLQNLMKRDPNSYRDELDQLYRHFEANMKVFLINPSNSCKALTDLVMFLCQVSHCYPEQLSELPEKLSSLLEEKYNVLHPEVRLTMCKGLILLRNKDMLSPLSVLQLFFVLFRCQDKILRKMLYDHVVTDIKNNNLKQRNNTLNKVLQNFMYSMLRDSHTIAARMSLDAMMELYRKQVWCDAKTVNVIVTACLSPTVKIMYPAVRFFLGHDTSMEESDDDSSDEEDAKAARKLVMASGVNKKSTKRRKKLEKQLAALRRQKKHKKKVSAPPSFSALHLIHDPQSFAEKLFQRLEKENHSMDVRFAVLDLTSKLIGVHRLFLFNFYPYVQRFLKPQQRDVTKLLAYTAQACHDLVPPDVVEPVLHTLADQFITERNSPEVMAVGMNAVREICTRCPLVMGDGQLIRDFCTLKGHRDRGVSAAARSLIQLCRTLQPDLLLHKDRGKPGVDHVPGRVVKPYGALDLAGDQLVKNSSMGEGKGFDQVLNEEEEEEEEDDDDEQDNDNEEEEDEDDEDEEVDGEDEEEDVTMEDEDDNSARSHKREDSESSSDEDSDSGPKELVQLKDITTVYGRKARSSREERLAKVAEGREGRKKFGQRKGKLNPHSSTTNKQKRKLKPFLMVQNKSRRLQSKKSFREKQMAFRKALLRRKKSR